jgi:hypothetical protein
VELKARVFVHGIEVDGEFADAILEAIAMKDLPYEVIIHKSKNHEAEAWCRQHFGLRWEAIGNRDGTWCCFWTGRELAYRYHFANERDMIWFSLKWL